MPYAPPSGNAVNFNFTDIPYIRPPGASIIFNFGGVPGPPFVDAQLPTGLRQHFTVEEDWFPEARRRFAPVSDIIANPMRALFGLRSTEDEWFPSVRRSFAPVYPSSDVIGKPMKALFQLDVDDIDYWMMPRRRILVTPPIPGRRPILFTVT